MVSTMGTFYEYISSFFEHWLAVVAAGAYFGLDTFLQNWFPEMMSRFNRITRPYRKALRIIVLFCAVFYAGYAAWEDEHRLRTEAEQGRLKAEVERDEARRQLSEQKLSLPFDVSGFNPMRPLSAEDKKKLRDLLGDNKDKLGRLYVARYIQPDTVLYSESILDAIKLSGLKVTEDIISPDSPTQTGVMLSCDDPDNLPENAPILIDVFKSIGIKVGVTTMLSEAKRKGSATGCILFMGPNAL